MPDLPTPAAYYRPTQARALRERIDRRRLGSRRCNTARALLLLATLPTACLTPPPGGFMGATFLALLAFVAGAVANHLAEPCWRLEAEIERLEREHHEARDADFALRARLGLRPWETASRDELPPLWWDGQG